MAGTRPLFYLLAALLGVVILPWDVTITPGPMVRDESPTDADKPQDTPTFTRDVLYFPCSGVRCQAWLYKPKRPTAAKPPIVVAAHGLGAQKDFGLEAYGEIFAAAGLASFIFDYRTFGGSDGEPRHWVSPKRHLQDWQSAIDFVQTDLADQVDASKLLLWGTSFAGGHVLTTAAKLGTNVTAVVAQVPFIDGKASFAKNIRERGILRIARAVIAALHDKARSLLTFPAAYYPLMGEPGGFNFMGLEQHEKDAYYAKHPKKKQGGWQNLGRCSLALEVSSYRPITLLPRVTAPVLFIAATRDSLCPLEGVKAAAALTPRAKLVTVDAHHFAVYSGEPLQQLTKEMVAFYKEAAGLAGPADEPADEPPAPASDSDSEEEEAPRDEL